MTRKFHNSTLQTKTTAPRERGDKEQQQTHGTKKTIKEKQSTITDLYGNARKDIRRQTNKTKAHP